MTDIRKIQSMLSQIEQELIANVPEHLFVQFLLPVLAAEPGHNSLEVWNHFAGSPFNRIRVVAANGEELFILPPMAVSIVTPHERDSRRSIFEVITGYEARTKVSPVYAEQYFQNAIQDKIIRPGRDIEGILLVDDILVRYGKPPRLSPELRQQLIMLQNGQTPSPSTPSSTTLPDVEDVGDDL